MAEKHKESSPADSKEKNTLLDDEIGKEFLGSWKSMSMADDDAMDFGFDTVSKGKKKTFDFEKLDMNFDLDSEFDKISSFKVDMSDLDFTSPPKKSLQSTEKKGEASSAKAGKKDGFNFNFDFNELDSFDLDSSLLKVHTNANSNQRKKGITTEGNDNEGAKRPKVNDDEGVHASNDNMAIKPQASERVKTLEVETSVSNLGNSVSRQDDSVFKFSSSGNLDMPFKNKTSDMSKSTSIKEMDQEREFFEKTKSTESKSEQVTNKMPSQSVGQSESEQDIIPEQHTKVFSSGTRGNTVSGDKQEVNDGGTFMDSNGAELQIERSSPPLTESDGSVREEISLGSSARRVTNDPKPEKCYTSCENITKTDVLRKNSCDNNIRESKRLTLERQLATASNKSVVDKFTVIKDKELQVIQSNMFSMPENKRSLKHPSSTAGTKSVSFDCKINADIHLRSKTQARDNIKSNDANFGSKSGSDSLPGSSKPMRDAHLPALLDSNDELKSRSNSRESTVFDVTPSAEKLAGNMKLFRDEANKSKGIFLETGTLTKSSSILSSQVNPGSLGEKTAITTQISVNSQPGSLGKEPLQKSKIASVEGNKLSSFKACKIDPAFSSLKISRNNGANSVLATSLHQKEANSLVNFEQSKEIHGIKASRNDHLTDSGDNQKPSTPFLKRKSIEVSEVGLTSLRSLKRLSQSSRENRNSKESSEVVEQGQSKPNDFLYYHSSSGLESPSEIKGTEVEIPDSVLMEDNSNVEKAETYMKELDNICNMLKKRHEEAKELLVRATVNNNNLLMLNHPIHEEEIRKVQKFASQLMSKGVQT